MVYSIDRFVHYETFDVRWMQSHIIRTQFEELEVQEDVTTESAGNNQ